jgi:hypothetical protein
MCMTKANEGHRAIESASMMATILLIISTRSGIGETSQYILSNQRMHIVRDEHLSFTTSTGL